MTFHDISEVIRMDGKAVIVTGGSKGIGEGCAKAFLAAGANVVICARGAADGEATAKKFCEEYGEGRCVFVPCDVSIETEIERVVEETVKTFGRIDCLVNNAGFHPPYERIEDVPASAFEELIRTNLVSMYSFCRYALPYLRKTKGSVINMSSLVGKMGQRNSCRYVSTKGGIHAFTRALAIDEAGNGVRVNSISPGCIVTPLAIECAGDDLEAAMKETDSFIHMGRQGDIYECGTVALFLASDMAQYLTGIDIVVSGGAELGYGVRDLSRK